MMETILEGMAVMRIVMWNLVGPAQEEPQQLLINVWRHAVMAKIWEHTPVMTEITSPMMDAMPIVKLSVAGYALVEPLPLQTPARPSAEIRSRFQVTRHVMMETR